MRMCIALIWCLLETLSAGASAVASEKVKPILIIGDSLSCGPFGKNLVKNLSASGNTVSLFCAVSSAPSNWLNGRNPSGQTCQTMTSTTKTLQPCNGTGQMPTLSSLLDAHIGANVIIALGTNSLLSPKVDSSYRKVAQMVKKSGAGCRWVGPPHLNPAESKGFPPRRVAKEDGNLNSFYDSLSNSMDANCDVIDSRAATASNTPGNQTVDGIHRTNSAGKYWVSHIMNQMDRRAKPTSNPSSVAQ